MSRRILLCITLSIAVSACGVKRPLLTPDQVPAYEEKLRRDADERERERLEEQRRQEVLQPIQRH